MGLWALQIIAFCFYLHFMQRPNFLGELGFCGLSLAEIDASKSECVLSQNCENMKIYVFLPINALLWASICPKHIFNAMLAKLWTFAALTLVGHGILDQSSALAKQSVRRWIIHAEGDKEGIDFHAFERLVW